MAEKTTLSLPVCSVCGKTKQEANHWFRLTTNNDLFMATTWEGPADWSVSDANGPVPQQHLCGAECAQKKFSEFLGVKR